MSADVSGGLHTPTPWERIWQFSRRDSFADSDDSFQILQVNGPRLAAECPEPDAAHIVRCVNAWADARALRQRIADLAEPRSISGHSPTPWTFEMGWDNPNRFWVFPARGLRIVATECSEADAEHIVRCANAWDDVAALRRRIAELEGPSRD